MKLYEIVKLLKSNGFTFVKAYENREVWEKNEKYLTIPTMYDTLNLRLSKTLKSKILKY